MFYYSRRVNNCCTFVHHYYNTRAAQPLTSPDAEPLMLGDLQCPESCQRAPHHRAAVWSCLRHLGTSSLRHPKLYLSNTATGSEAVTGSRNGDRRMSTPLEYPYQDIYIYIFNYYTHSVGDKQSRFTG